jgi:NAD(P)H-hydrate repair Nnr-like enzyme with NAD(P)H-hydrate epimerase domain
MSPLGRSAALLALALAVPLLVAGCGKTVIDDVKTEDAIEQNLEDSVGKKVAAVDCPSGVEVEVGESFDCSVTLSGGKRETATLEILNEDADVELTDLQPDK